MKKGSVFESVDSLLPAYLILISDCIHAAAAPASTSMSWLHTALGWRNTQQKAA